MWLAWCSGVLVAAVGFWLRVRPRLWLREFGVDTWYYLTAAEARRAQPRGWLRLPYFLLDIPEQWYPPLLTRLLSWLPQRSLERWQWLISPFIDTAQLAITYAVTYALTGHVAAAVVAGLVYATFPLLVTQHSTLNSRALGSICLTLTMLALWRWSASGGWWWAVAVTAGGVVVLHAHKLATQQLLFLLVGLAMLRADWRYAGWLVAIGAAALVVSRGRYRKILRGHLEILRFWRRQLPWLGAHLIYDSSLHRDPVKSSAKRGVSGLRGSRIFSLLAYAHGAMVAGVVGSAVWWSRGAADPFLIGWALIGFATVAVISWLQPVRFLGEGFRYAMYLACPASILIGQWAISPALPVALRMGIVVAVVAVGCAVSLFLQGAQRHSALAAADGGFNEAVEWLRAAPRDGVICLPATRADAVAYRARKRVLWGAHSSGYDRLVEFFPVLRRPLDELAARYRTSYLVVDRRYVDLPDLRLRNGWRTVFERGTFQILERQVKES